MFERHFPVLTLKGKRGGWGGERDRYNMYEKERGRRKRTMREREREWE